MDDFDPDYGLRWRRTSGGYRICDPSLDWAIEALSPVARRLLAAGVNLTYEQAQALSPQPEENLRDNQSMGKRNAPPEPEQ